MDREEFLELRRMKGKLITVDIEFAPVKQLTDDNRVFLAAPVENAAEYVIYLNGSYNRRSGSLTFNFVLQGVGPICRVDVNGPQHPGSGRTHKHELQKESDPARQLPTAIARKDLEKKSPREVWEVLCGQANIEHTGKFIDP